ncbi:hypothetical protein DCF50_p2876 [Dehalobacter sp. CF]|nr:hypothetical protein DCF50_p2876 [Dehalobacter sp. CF]
MYRSLTPRFAPDIVRVPRGGTLPLASFRFHLAVDTLALS